MTDPEFKLLAAILAAGAAIIAAIVAATAALITARRNNQAQVHILHLKERYERDIGAVQFAQKDIEALRQSMNALLSSIQYAKYGVDSILAIEAENVDKTTLDLIDTKLTDAFDSIRRKYADQASGAPHSLRRIWHELTTLSRRVNELCSRYHRELVNSDRSADQRITSLRYKLIRLREELSDCQAEIRRRAPEMELEVIHSHVKLLRSLEDGADHAGWLYQRRVINRKDSGGYNNTARRVTEKTYVDFDWAKECRRAMESVEAFRDRLLVLKIKVPSKGREIIDQWLGDDVGRPRKQGRVDKEVVEMALTLWRYMAEAVSRYCVIGSDVDVNVMYPDSARRTYCICDFRVFSGVLLSQHRLYGMIVGRPKEQAHGARLGRELKFIIGEAFREAR